MPPIQIFVTIGIFLITAVFQAGMVFAAFRRLKKDVDGVGRKVNRMDEDRRRQAVMTVIVLMRISTKITDQELADLLMKMTF